mmetsp:Transcript_104456/g.162888  ORF Transcript_104456/g.162888 Transcript_104456/m.162888 type:complete len:269 (+) Transcript_104456:46-852(+)
MQANFEEVLLNVLKHELAQLRLQIQVDIQEELRRFVRVAESPIGMSHGCEGCQLKFVGKENALHGRRDRDKQHNDSGRAAAECSEATTEDGSPKTSLSSLEFKNPMLKERLILPEDSPRPHESSDAGVTVARRAASKEKIQHIRSDPAADKQDVLRECFRNGALRLRLKTLQDHDTPTSKATLEQDSELDFGKTFTEPSPQRLNSQTFRFPVPKRSNTKSSREMVQLVARQDEKVSAGIDTAVAKMQDTSNPDVSHEEDEQNYDDISF